MTQLGKEQSSLYICYFGVRQPLVQTQVIPYLVEIAKGNIEISLLTFEPEDFDSADLVSQLRAKGIRWHSLRYHKRPSAIATFFDVMNGARLVAKLIRQEKFDILHARVHVPMLMAALARKRSRHKPKLLFDIRGFFPEEYTDAGIWKPDGALFRLVKRVERWLMKEADGFVVLTENARKILFPESAKTGYDKYGRPVEVIPCCVDLTRFASGSAESREQLRTEYNLGDRFVVAYVGAFGGWYLTEETADFFGVLKKNRPDAFALILTQSPMSMIEPLLQKRGYAASDFLITKVDPTEVPRHLSAADAAVSFIMPCYSKQASSPTKNAEYLACGLPIVANAGIGDVDLLLRDNRVGAIVKDLSAGGYSSALTEIELLGDVAERCRRTAQEQFDLETVGGARYRRLYRRLLGG